MRMSRHARLVLVVFGLIFFARTAPRLLAADGDPQKLAQFVLSGYKDGRDRLRSGVFRAEGRVVKQPKQGQGIEGDVEIFAAFDYEKGLFRFDRTEPVILNIPGIKHLPPSDPTSKRQAPTKSILDPSIKSQLYETKQIGKWIRTPSQSIRWVPPWKFGDMRSASGVGILAPDETPIREASPFDVRTLGLLYWHDLTVGRSFEAMLGFLQARSYVDSVAESKGLYRIRSRQTNGPDGPMSITSTSWFDETKGFAPTRLELRDPRVAGTAGRPDDLITTSEVGYEQISGAWVPTSYRIEDHTTEDKLSYEFTLRWESVNQPVPPVYFTVEGLEAPKGTFVTDTRLGKPIMLSKLGEPPKLPELQSPSRQAAWPLIAVGLALALACFLGIWAQLRRRRGAAKSEQTVKTL